MTKHLSLVALAAVALLTTSIANAAEPVPGDSCTAGQENYFQRTGGNEIPTGHFMVCKSGTWRSILSWDAAAAITKIGNLSCTNGQILKFNGTTWGCSTDNGGTLPTLTSANIWVGNGSNAATAVAMSGDATLSNAGVLTISSNAVGSAEITNASIVLADLSATGTASAATYLRGDNTWATVPSGADNLGDHIATTVLRSDAHNTDDLGTTAIRWKDGWFAGTVTGGTFAGSGAALTALNATNLSSGTVAAARMPALNGDVTMTAGTTATIIANNVVSNTKLANMAANTIKGNNTGAAAAPADVTVAQLRTMLAPTGTPGTTTFLRGDGQWIAPPSGADNLGDHIATTGLRSDTHNTDDLGTTAIRWKDGWFAGTITGGTFAGSGASLTSLPAANLTGTLPAISGANLTSLNASNLASGTVPAARLPAYTGDVTKAAGGTALTIAAGAVDLAHMSATGTKNATTFLRGDNTWAAPAPVSVSRGLDVFTSSGTWVVPAGVTWAKATLIGGGGGGARSGNSTFSHGGGAGAFIVKWIAVTPGASMPVTIGAGGTAAAAVTTNGGDGGDTIFGSVTAQNGEGGTWNSGTRSAGGVASGGDLNISGADGVNNSATGGGEAGQFRSEQSYGNGGNGGSSPVAATAGKNGYAVIEW